MKKLTNCLLIVVICLCFFAACKHSDTSLPSATKNSPTKKEAPSSVPSFAPSATPTPTPSPTPSPSPLPTPTPTPEPELEDLMTEMEEPGMFTLPDLELEGCYLNVFHFKDRLLYFFNETGDASPRIISYSIPTGERIEKTLDYIEPLGYMFYTVKDKYIVICQNYKDYYYLDENLNEIKKFSIPTKYDIPDATFNSDFSTVYYIYDGCLYSCDTDGGEPVLLLKDKKLLDAYPEGVTEDGRFLIASVYSYGYRGYVDYYYDLETGELLDFNYFSYGMEYHVSPDGNTLIAESKAFEYTDVFPVNENFTGIRDLREADNGEREKPECVRIRYNSTCEKLFDEIDWERGFCFTANDYDTEETMVLEINCYNLKTGELHSNLLLPLESPFGNSFALSLDAEKGYLFISGAELKDTFCYVWDYVSDKVEDMSRRYPRKGIIPKYLDAKRDELEEKYNMNFYLGTEVFATKTDYILTYCESPSKMYEALCIFDEIFSLYPDGLINQIRYKEIKSLGVYTCAGFTKDAEYGITNAAALAGNDGYEKFLVLDVMEYGDLRKYIIHELSHWIDNRINQYGYATAEFDFEQIWAEQNPSDFYYMNDYNATSPFSRYTKGDDRYFVDEYALSKATEDRSRIFENIMRYDPLWTEEYFKSEHLREKARVYFEYIRKAFDTTGWPEETIWEKKLRMLDEYYSGESEITLEDIYPEKSEDKDYSLAKDSYGISASTYYKNYFPIFG